MSLIRSRRSIRKYKGEVDEKRILKIIEEARWAPSAGNLQSWDVVLVKEQSRKDMLARAALNQGFIAQAPYVLVVCANIPRTSRVYRSRGANLYAIQDTAAFIQTLLLLITASGLGACWIGAFHTEHVAEAVLATTKPGIIPVAIIPIGMPAKSPSAPSRLSLKKILHYETYGNQEPSH